MYVIGELYYNSFLYVYAQYVGPPVWGTRCSNDEEDDDDESNKSECVSK